ncbi:hypothetical protein CGLO_14261 [Colletotrichum gloeosporioides Cg-14]|uniref:Uncharacterized protein n=1 Tax=Colletotrichum gloeosporioides (strain Cg-14) TaxID=1237896 RepID=T0K4A3_COLGC|nr:hypothetical protein CGLO_14261 [Colletotrichum gloeosporioides Cg-14]
MDTVVPGNGVKPVIEDGYDLLLCLRRSA